MWPALVLFALGAEVCYGNVIPLSSLNTTRGATRTSSVPSTITSGPSNDAIAVNTCSYYNETESRTLWNDPYCSMYAGSVDLIFWPTDNQSYPATFYDSKADYTYSSPSVYMVVNTLYGWNACGLLGPSTSREVFGFDLTEVFTLAPYTDEADTRRRSTVQLTLSDLGTHCTGSYNKSELAIQTHPMASDDTRCNPFLVVPGKIKQYGYPYWMHCGVAHNKFGLFDPPYAVPAVEGLLPVTTTTAEQKETDSPTAAASAITKASAPSPQAPTTVESSASDPTSVENLDSGNAADSGSKTTNSLAADPTEAGHEDSPSNSQESIAKENTPADENSSAGNPENNSPASTGGTPIDSSQNIVISSDGASNPTVVIQSQATTFDPEFDPNGYTDAVVATVTGQQIVSLGTAGLEVVNPDTGRTSTYAVPAPGSVTDGSSIIAATVAVYNGETISLGGPAVTISGAIVVSPTPTPSNAPVNISTGSSGGLSPSTTGVPSSASSLSYSLTTSFLFLTLTIFL